MPEVAREGRACLRDYGGDGAPVIVVPSLINPPFVLDLTPETSLLRWLARQGHHVLLVDWGVPTAGDSCDIGMHVEHLLLPMLHSLSQAPALVGYCLGGTMAIGAACLTQVAGLALLAAPWRFGGYGSAERDALARFWSEVRPSCDAMEIVPMEVLQAAFWNLDPARTVGKFEQFAALDPASDAARAFVALEDWANAGAPLPLEAGRQLFERFYAADDPGRGRWRIGERTIDPATISAPIVDFVSTGDRIVPAASSSNAGDRRDITAGHVGMIVGRRARDELWAPLEHWLSTLPRPK